MSLIEAITEEAKREVIYETLSGALTKLRSVKAQSAFLVEKLMKEFSRGEIDLSVEDAKRICDASFGGDANEIDERTFDAIGRLVP